MKFHFEKSPTWNPTSPNLELDSALQLTSQFVTQYLWAQFRNMPGFLGRQEPTSVELELDCPSCTGYNIEKGIYPQFQSMEEDKAGTLTIYCPLRHSSDYRPGLNCSKKKSINIDIRNLRDRK